MAILIKHRHIAADSWQLLDGDTGRWTAVGEDGLVPDFPAWADLIVPLRLWRARREDLLARDGLTGVWLAPDEDPAPLADALPEIPLVAVRFPKFSDGRGYSIGRLLRERYGFAGELRAIGDVGRDQLLAMERCGFDAFALRPGEDAERALRAFRELTEAYQGTVPRPLPLFRRRLAAGA